MRQEISPSLATGTLPTWASCSPDVSSGIDGYGGSCVSEVEPGDRLVLFATAAYRASNTAGWVMPVHGRIFRPPDGRAARVALALALKTGFGVAPNDLSQATFDERCALMLGESMAGRRIVVTVAGSDRLLAPSDRYGHFRGDILVPDVLASTFAINGRLGISVRFGRGDPRQVEGRALLVPATGVSVISDIDDTVKVTHVASRRRMMARTFLEAFEAVPGTAQRYRSWVRDGAALHFISSSPWLLYEPLMAFLTTAGFPSGTITLKNVALKDRSIRNLLAKATKTKPPAIDAIVKHFPHRQFVLVGDSAENDAEIYADAVLRHPGRIVRILIRDCGSSRPANLERARHALSRLDAGIGQIFSRASELPVRLR